MSLFLTTWKAVVIHGGKKGIPEPDTMNLDEFRPDGYDPDSCQAPLLLDVLQILADGNMHAQLELKGPLSDPETFLAIVNETFGDRAVRRTLPLSLPPSSDSG